MRASEAWFTVIALTIILMAMLAVSGLVSELLAPEVQRQIASSWSQGPR